MYKIIYNFASNVIYNNKIIYNLFKIIFKVKLVNSRANKLYSLIATIPPFHVAIFIKIFLFKDLDPKFAILVVGYLL